MPSLITSTDQLAMTPLAAKHSSHRQTRCLRHHAAAFRPSQPEYWHFKTEWQGSHSKARRIMANTAIAESP
jgi:hypothetical protein